MITSGVYCVFAVVGKSCKMTDWLYEQITIIMLTTHIYIYYMYNEDEYPSSSYVSRKHKMCMSRVFIYYR